MISPQGQLLPAQERLYNKMPKLFQKCFGCNLVQSSAKLTSTPPWMVLLSNDYSKESITSGFNVDSPFSSSSSSKKSKIKVTKEMLPLLKLLEVPTTMDSPSLLDVLYSDRRVSFFVHGNHVPYRVKCLMASNTKYDEIAIQNDVLLHLPHLQNHPRL